MMLTEEIYIRIPDEGIAFFYTVVRAGETIESGRIDPCGDDPDEFVPGYFYGGSQAMD